MTKRLALIRVSSPRGAPGELLARREASHTERRALGWSLLLPLGLLLSFACGEAGGGIGDSSSTPAAVFEGGAGELQVQFTTNQRAVLKTTFSRYEEGTDEEQNLDSAEDFAAGSHSRTIDVSPSTYIYLELGIPNASPGADLSWTISIDGRRVLQESDRLEDALRAGYAFFLQAEADDIGQMRSWER